MTEEKNTWLRVASKQCDAYICMSEVICSILLLQDAYIFRSAETSPFVRCICS